MKYETMQAERRLQLSEDGVSHRAARKQSCGHAAPQWKKWRVPVK